MTMAFAHNQTVITPPLLCHPPHLRDGPLTALRGRLLSDDTFHCVGCGTVKTPTGRLPASKSTADCESTCSPDKKFESKQETGLMNLALRAAAAYPISHFHGDCCNKLVIVGLPLMFLRPHQSVAFHGAKQGKSVALAGVKQCWRATFTAERQYTGCKLSQPGRLGNDFYRGQFSTALCVMRTTTLTVDALL